MWLDESGRAKAPDWLNSQAQKTWLDENGRVKLPDWLNSQPKKPDWRIFIFAEIWLVDFYNVFLLLVLMFFWPLGMNHRCSFDLWGWIIDVLLTFGDESSMFFWPLGMNHRCSFDLWSWLIDVVLTFEHDSSRFCCILVLMFFLPLTLKQTTAFIFFIWPSLQSRELKSMFFWPLIPHLYPDSNSPTPITQGPTKLWPSMVNNY
jgi:hypothetical protein